MEDRYEEEEKSPAATIAVVGLLAVIVICGGLFLLGQRNQKSQAGQTAEASNAPEQARWRRTPQRSRIARPARGGGQHRARRVPGTAPQTPQPRSPR